jgi:SAM-dependent methyltransferase
MNRKLNTGVVPSEWEKFANEDPYTYILTDLEGLQDFWQRGHRTVHEELLPIVRNRRLSRRTAFELGCGLGRLAFPLAAHFQTVIGVDIAGEMIRRARRFASENCITNTHFSTIAGPKDLLETNEFVAKVDFLYSWLVFQHIPEFATIAGYLRAIGFLLHDNGVACLQFDTRPASLAYHVKSGLPDFLLPRFWRRGIRRIRRSPLEIEECLHEAGLQVLGELAPATELHRYIVCKSGRRPAKL